MLVPTLFVFFLSGVAALLYQVVWQRMLVIFSGADVYSSTIIVAAFMAGLGVGHLTGGHVADRLSRRTSLIWFAAAELAIAAFSVLSRELYYDLLYQRLGPLAVAPAVMAGILFASLLWPTFFMGMSLPLLARAVTENIDRAASTVGALYGFNTLGAAVGALVSTWWVLPRFGLEESLRIGAMLNLTCAAIVLVVARLLSSSRAGDSLAAPPASSAATASASPPAASLGNLTFVFWASIYTLSGLLALSLEIVWFRLLGVMVKSTAFTFGTLLAVYLTGMGSGAVFGSVFASRIRRPAVAFLGLQTAIGLSAACLFAVFIGILDDVAWFRAYFGTYDPLPVEESVGRLRALAASLVGAAPAPESLPWQFLVLYFGLPAVLIGPPTFLMGCSFPLLQQVVQTDIARLGRRVGVLLLANVAGSVLGTVATGWVLINALGTAGTLRVLAGLSGLFPFVGITLLVRDRRVRWGRWPVPVAAVAVASVLVLVVASMPDAATLWARLHGTSVDRIIFGEDASGLSVLRAGPGGFPAQTIVFVNGLGQSVLPYGDIHTALGMVPAFLHPNPKKAVVIGLGSGDTVYGVAGRPEIERVTCIEIIGPQLDTLQRLSRRGQYGGLLGLLGDPRIDHVSGDGRTYLMRSGRKYDIIEADALRPNSAYSGNLYSDAYFMLVRDHLSPNGLAATWAPTARVHNAFVRVFPYVLSVPGILLGSNEPIEVDRKAIAARLSDPRVRDHYGRAGVDIEQLLSFYLAEPARYGPEFDRDRLTDFNTDLFPKDEYDLGVSSR